MPLKTFCRYFTLALVMLLNSVCAKAADYPTPKEGTWTVKDYRFHNREVLPELKMHYMTIGEPSGAPVLVLCRSGARSRAAAIALTQAGFQQAINIADGFEGDRDGEGHRGNHNGWKAADLPWRQG